MLKILIDGDCQDVAEQLEKGLWHYKAKNKDRCSLLESEVSVS